jgi:hypothetical protein
MARIFRKTFRNRNIPASFDANHIASLPAPNISAAAIGLKPPPNMAFSEIRAIPSTLLPQRDGQAPE